MITEDYISFETAKLLKEKGFDENTPVNYFVGDDKPRGCAVGEMIYHKRAEEDTHLISCPTIQMAMKWLREKNDIAIEINVGSGSKDCWVSNVIKDYKAENGTYMQTLVRFSYEEACEAAIKYCLENLI